MSGTNDSFRFLDLPTVLSISCLTFLSTSDCAKAFSVSHDFREHSHIACLRSTKATSTNFTRTAAMFLEKHFSEKTLRVLCLQLAANPPQAIQSLSMILPKFSSITTLRLYFFCFRIKHLEQLKSLEELSCATGTHRVGDIAKFTKTCRNIKILRLNLDMRPEDLEAILTNLPLLEVLEIPAVTTASIAFARLKRPVNTLRRLWPRCRYWDTDDYKTLGETSRFPNMRELCLSSLPEGFCVQELECLSHLDLLELTLSRKNTYWNNGEKDEKLFKRMADRTLFPSLKYLKFHLGFRYLGGPLNKYGRAKHALECLMKERPTIVYEEMIADCRLSKDIISLMK